MGNYHLKGDPTETAGLDTQHAFGSTVRATGFKAGAAGYITKDSLPEELAGAIDRVAKGENTLVRCLPSYWSWTLTTE